jgi:hypothetical protein
MVKIASEIVYGPTKIQQVGAHWMELISHVEMFAENVDRSVGIHGAPCIKVWFINYMK